VRQLSALSGHSDAKIKRIIQRTLKQDPPGHIKPLSDYNYLVLDGTFLHRPKSILAVMDAETNTIIAGEYGVSESSIPQLYTFLRPLKRRGLTPVSCTIDGNPRVYKVLKELWPDIIIQRCLVHIQRQGLSWCRRFPKRTDAKHLRNLFKQVCYIDSHQQQNQFMRQLIRFEDRFGSDIEMQPGKGKVFSDLKRARSMLVKAVPHMFHYLDDANFPKTTNALEGYYSRLKQRYRQHRGLTRDKLHTYFNWYFYLKPM